MFFQDGDAVPTGGDEAVKPEGDTAAADGAGDGAAMSDM